MLNLKPVALLACAAALVSCNERSTTGPTSAEINLSMGASGPSASGHGHFNTVGPEGPELRTFSFHARTHADGTTRGSYELHNRAQNARIHGEIDCLRIVGNIAYMSGVHTHHTTPAFEGLASFFSVMDNGEGNTIVPDLISLLFTFNPPGPSCNVTFVNPTFPIDGGNIQVNP